MPTFYLIQPSNQILESLDNLVVTEAINIQPIQALNLSHAKAMLAPPAVTGGPGYDEISIRVIHPSETPKIHLDKPHNTMSIEYPQIRPLIGVLKTMLGEDE